jgi:hypothetical protein
MSSFNTKSYSIKITNNIKKEMDKWNSLKNSTVRVGIIGSSARENGLTNAYLLFLHTVGSYVNNIPSRPVLDAIEVKQEEFASDTAKVMKKLAINQIDVLMTLRQIGAVALSYALLSFETKGFGRWAELKPQTIKNKGSDAILIETSEMRRAITFDVIQ